jgi:hypothetical protein
VYACAGRLCAAIERDRISLNGSGTRVGPTARRRRALHGRQFSAIVRRISRTLNERCRLTRSRVITRFTKLVVRARRDAWHIIPRVCSARSSVMQKHRDRGRISTTATCRRSACSRSAIPSSCAAMRAAVLSGCSRSTVRAHSPP